MPTWTVGEFFHGFRVVKTAPVPMLNAQYWQLTHEKTGATLYYSDRDDGQMMFSVGFRTLPEDDTGVFHILEHSTLDGSEHFPLKEPFVNLMKTSMAVDLNAMTYEDKTLYYFISTDEQDFMNMMTVYLDAVFHPMLLSDRRIFEKEAWHLEPTEEGGLRCSGVVFNEMQGNDNNPMMALFYQMEKQLYPDLCHRFSSGGDPAFIHTLTYEKFAETYHRFYGADNAMIYLSGNIGFDRELSYLDEVLSGLEKPVYAKPSPAPLQAPVISPDGVTYYQLADKDDVKGNTQLGLAFVMNDISRPEDALGLSLLSRYLTETTESPLSKPVLAAGVGMDFNMGVETMFRQPMIFFMMGKSDPENAEGFRTAVLDTLQSLVNAGLDYEHLNRIIESMVTDMRRSSLSVQTGFNIMESIFSSHVQCGEAELPDNLIPLRRHLAENPRWFEELIETYILNSNHWALTKCIPSRTLTEEKRQKMDEWLKEETQKLRAVENGYEALQTHFAAFNEYLVAPDAPEAEASVPHLTPADITSRPAVDDFCEDTATIAGKDVTSLKFITNANGMVHASLMFDLTGLTLDELHYVSCLTDALFSLPTASCDVPTLTGRKLAALANLSFATENVVRPDDRQTSLYLRVILDVPKEHLAEALSLVNEYLTEPVFDRTILKQIFSNPDYFKTILIRRGNGTAARAASTALTASAVYTDTMSGIGALHRMQQLAAHFDEEADAFMAGLDAVCRKLVTVIKPVVLYIGEEDGYTVWKQALSALTYGTDAPAQPLVLPVTLANQAPKAYIIPGEVNYCASVSDIHEIGAVFSPHMKVVSSLINTRYFWDEIRAKGGAYGAGCGINPSGLLTMTSYRDPRIDDTYGVYANLADWLDANIPGQEELGSLIVSSLSPYFTPRSPIDRGLVALNLWLVGRTAAQYTDEINTILSTEQKDFIAVADIVRKLNGHGIRAVLGGSQSIEHSALFGDAVEL